VAETSFADESATLLAELRDRLLKQEEARKRAARRAYYGVAVAVVHILFIYLLIESQWLPFALPKPAHIQPLTWVILSQPAKAPRILPAKPKDKGENSATVFVPPKTFKPQEEENNAITDFGLALGRSLACTANSYEWLNTKRRANCLRRPWQFVYDPYGNIVLDARELPPPEPEKVRPSDAMAHERNTAPTCPQNVDPNAPCLGAIVGGRR
jgi:hypothetical protein